MLASFYSVAFCYSCTAKFLASKSGLKDSDIVDLGSDCQGQVVRRVTILLVI